VDTRREREAASGTPQARQVRLAWSLSAHAQRLITLALAGLVIAVITRRPEFAGVAAPAVLLLAVRRPERPGRVDVNASPSGTKLTEGEQAELTVTVTGQGDHSVDLLMHPRFAVVPGTAGGLRGGKSAVPFQVTRTGRRSLGALEVTLRDRWRLTEGHATLELPIVDCYPMPAAHRKRVVLSKLPSRLGEHPSRSSGEGLEFTGVREFVPGDRQRRINWPATTRRGRLQLNTFAAERTQNVVIIADASSDVGEPGSTPADLAFRGAAGAARAYLAVRDRVGVIVYQRSVRWVAPGLGARHYYRIMNLMLLEHARVADPARYTAITRLPRAALPPGSLILVYSTGVSSRLCGTCGNADFRC
jgi:uncharacterized protein (DUF58 family)